MWTPSLCGWTEERLCCGAISPYDDVTRIESYFLDLYISAHYIPEPSIPGCICYATVVSGTVSMTAEGQTFQLIERGALRFAADHALQL